MEFVEIIDSDVIIKYRLKTAVQMNTATLSL